MARTTDNLGLTVPDVGEPAEQWTQEISDSFDAIDAHDHAHSGKRITQEALAIAGPLTLNGQPLRAAASVELNSQTTAPTGPGRLYAGSDGNLYFRSGSDVPVQITSGTVVAAPGGGIGGDYTSTGASLSFNASGHTYLLFDQSGAPAAIVAANGTLQQLSLGDTSPSSPRTLATIGGELYYRDTSNRVFPLTNNGAAAGADIRGDYHSTTASVTYNQTTKTYTFVDQTTNPARLSAGSVSAPSYLYPSALTRRLSVSPAIGVTTAGAPVSGVSAWGAGQDYLINGGQTLAYPLPVLRANGTAIVVLTAVGVDVVSTTPSVLANVGATITAQENPAANWTYPTVGGTSSSVTGSVTSKVWQFFDNMYRDSMVTVLVTLTGSSGTTVPLRRIWAEYQTTFVDAWSS